MVLVVVNACILKLMIRKPREAYHSLLGRLGSVSNDRDVKASGGRTFVTHTRVQVGRRSAPLPCASSPRSTVAGHRRRLRRQCVCGRGPKQSTFCLRYGVRRSPCHHHHAPFAGRREPYQQYATVVVRFPSVAAFRFVPAPRATFPRLPVCFCRPTRRPFVRSPVSRETNLHANGPTSFRPCTFGRPCSVRGQPCGRRVRAQLC